MSHDAKKNALAATEAGVADDESTASTDVQDRAFDDECRQEAALRLASACTAHPAGQAGVARQIGMTSDSAIKRFHRYCTGERTAPVHVIEKIRRRCPRVFAAWVEGLRRDALRTPVAIASPERADANRASANARFEEEKAKALANGQIDPPEVPRLVRKLEDVIETATEEKASLLGIGGRR